MTKLVSAQRGKHLLGAAFGLLLLVYILGPIAWIVSSSLQLDRDLFTPTPQFIPRAPTLDNYRYILTGQAPESYIGAATGGRVSREALSIVPALKNSFIVSISVTIINLLLSTLAAYTFARIRFRGDTLAYTVVLLTRLVPGMTIAIPMFVVMDRLGLLDTHLALIIVYLTFTLPFTMWFLTKYFKYLPHEIEEAAMLDGCTRFQALLRIVAPVAAPGLAAVAALTFMAAYSEFLFALFLTRSMASKTAPLVLVSAAVNHDVSFALAFAALVLTIIPVMALALIFRKYITQGYAVGFGR
ncbi:MAG: carbohydrate ABC transporter permease [Limnochordales bacterium]|nr:carbohydrate ABC transporter permease [Limnochordales bacterium]